MTTLPGAAAPGPYRVLIADDDPFTRDLTKQALDGHGFVVVAEAADATAAVAAVSRERPDMCLIEVRMPGGGIRATAEIIDIAPDTRVVMYTMAQSDADLFDALRAAPPATCSRTLTWPGFRLPLSECSRAKPPSPEPWSPG